MTMEEFSGTVQQAGALVRQTRRAKGWNQSELAARAGVSRKFVSEFELGHPRAELSKALSLLGAVGVRVKFFETERPREAVQVDLRKHKRRYASRSAAPGMEAR